VALSLTKPLIHILPGVGPTLAQHLEKLNLLTVEDLLHHYPFRYEDRDATQNLALIADGEIATVTGTLEDLRSSRTRTGKTIQRGNFLTSDDTLIEVIWFNQPYLVNTLKRFHLLTLSGKIKRTQSLITLQSPIWEAQGAQNFESLHTNRTIPIYHTTQGITNKWLRSKIAWLLKHVEIAEHLDNPLLAEFALMPLSEALKTIHFPKDVAALEKAQQRLRFDELLLWQLRAQMNKQAWAQRKKSLALTISSDAKHRFLKALPFALTSAQLQAISAIEADLKQEGTMNRLVQGDVGSGKTVVAAFACYVAACNHLPSVFMAPTETLALQHADTLTGLLEPLGITINTQTRSQKTMNEDAQVFIGTHALLHRALPEKLGIVIIDEQHRFGVKQRAQLLERVPAPHVLSMTATPIPRTVALTLYADLDISVIDQMPPGRISVKTWVVPPTKREKAYAWISEQIHKQQTQAFIVCPLIEDSENSQLAEVKAAQTEYARLKQEVFPHLKLGLVHGKLSSKAKSGVIDAFKNKETHILVATPVIEVGIDIPNATIMMIEGAERFGLAQLHQLRGRVGRGNQQSYCLLFTSSGNSSQRLKHLETTNSGFALAELDMQLRGMGDLYGVKQSGAIELKIASLSDASLITTTHKAAEHLLTLDPNLEKHELLKEKLNSLLEKGVAAN
jgi:ATP-dependent DNA helicase RecG